MDMLEIIKAKIEHLYKTHPDVHINVSMTRPRTTVLNEPVTIIGVYRHISLTFSILFGIIRSVKFSEVSNMSDNKLLDLSIGFAVAVVNLSDSIKMPKS